MTTNNNNNDFGIDSWEKMSKEQLINHMTLIVKDWLKNRTTELFGKLYRLDISEKDIKWAMSTKEAAKNIAVLIIERQYQKFLSRKSHPNPPIQEEDEDMLW